GPSRGDDAGATRDKPPKRERCRECESADELEPLCQCPVRTVQFRGQLFPSTRSRPEGDSRSDANNVRQHTADRAPHRARGTHLRLVGVSEEWHVALEKIVTMEKLGSDPACPDSRNKPDLRAIRVSDRRALAPG